MKIAVRLARHQGRGAAHDVGVSWRRCASRSPTTSQQEVVDGLSSASCATAPRSSASISTAGLPAAPKCAIDRRRQLRGHDALSSLHRATAGTVPRGVNALAQPAEFATASPMPPAPRSRPDQFPDLPPIAGVRLAAGRTGIRYKGRNDLMLVELAPGTTVAGVFTRSLTASPPVEWCRKQPRRGKARARRRQCRQRQHLHRARRAPRRWRPTAAAAAKLVGCKRTRCSSPRPASSASSCRWTS